MKRILSVFLAVVISLLLCACASVNRDADEYNDSISYGGESYVDGGTKYFAENTSTSAQKNIYNANVSLETTTFDDALNDLEALLPTCGAYVESASVDGIDYSTYYYQSQTYRRADYTIRVPADRFDALVAGMCEIGHVTSESRNSENVTAKHTDLQSRILAYRTEESALLDMMKYAENVSDLIEIQTRLSDVRWEIEYYTSSLRGLNDSISNSTVYVVVKEVKEIIETPPQPPMTYWQEIGAGFVASMKGVGRFFSNFFSWLLRNLPVLTLILSIIGGVFVLIFFRVRKKRKQRKLRRDEKKSKKAEKKSAKKMKKETKKKHGKKEKETVSGEERIEEE